MIQRLELYVCFGVFIWSVVYSILCFYQSSQDKLYEVYDANFETSDCYFFLTCNRPKDVADLEWQIFKQYFIGSKVVILLLHLVGFYLTRKLIPKHLSTFVILYSSSCIIYLLSPYALLLYFAYISFTIVLKYLIDSLQITNHRSIYHYILFIFSIYGLHGIRVFSEDLYKNTLFQIGFGWLSSRCLSCTLDIYNSNSSEFDANKVETSFDYLSKLRIRLSYLLYFPPFFFGPIYHYDDFANYLAKIEQNKHSSVDENFFANIIKLFRYIAWAWILEIFAHFIYTSTFQSYVFIVEDFDAWSICGFCFALCVMFFVKYAVFYGISHAMAEIDGFSGVIARPPLCIAHINKNSYIWRKFDKGLYLFLIKYFYKPLMNLKWNNLLKKIIATLAIFTIIAIWHGMHRSVVVWISINVLISYSEIIGLEVLRSTWFSGFENSLSPSAKLRLYAICGVPLLGLSYLSHVIFLSNIESGMLFLTKVLLQFPIPMLPTIFVLYCVYYASAYINRQLRIDHK